MPGRFIGTQGLERHYFRILNFEEISRKLLERAQACVHRDGVSGVCQSRDDLQAEILYIPPKEDCVLIPLLFFSTPVSQEEKIYCPCSHLDLPLVRKIPRKEQLIIPKAGQPLQVRIPVLTVPPRLRLLHCTGIKLHPKKRRCHPRESISHQDHTLVLAAPLPSLS